MSPRLSRLGLTALLAVTLCFGILLGSVVTTAPMRVLGQNPVDEETVLLQRLYQQVNPSVVNILVRVPVGSANPDLIPSTPFPGPRGGQQQPEAQAEASGFVYDTDGNIVTNAHVVQDATRITVNFADDTARIARVVGIDLDSDLAVIKIDPGAVKLTPLLLADSDELAVGERTIAIGNPFGFGGTMTQGIVSALGRSLDSQRDSSPDQRYLIPSIIQTDAAINPGNSGGPLLNGKGEVIGINTAIESRVRQSSGVGFAIPSNIVKKIVPALIKDGKITHSYLGIGGRTLTLDLNDLVGLDPNFHGVLINDVTRGGPADTAGVRPGTVQEELDGVPIMAGGDVIVGVDDVPVRRFEDLLGYLFLKTDPGQVVTLKVYREGKTIDVKVTLGERPAAQ
jgi:S1-C subfamily serine protease